MLRKVFNSSLLLILIPGFLSAATVIPCFADVFPMGLSGTYRSASGESFPISGHLDFVADGGEVSHGDVVNYFAWIDGFPPFHGSSYFGQDGLYLDVQAQPSVIDSPDYPGDRGIGHIYFNSFYSPYVDIDPDPYERFLYIDGNAYCSFGSLDYAAGLTLYDLDYFGVDMAIYVLEGSNWSSQVLERYEVTARAPVPEPSTMLLLGSGLVGLAGLRKKFRRA